MDIFEIYIHNPSVNQGYLQGKLRTPYLSIARPHKHLLQRSLNT